MANTYCSGTRADQCHVLPCYIDSFTVNVTAADPVTVRFTVVDGCNVLTGAKMLSAVIRKAIAAAAVSDDTTEEEGCCRDMSDWDLNVAGKYMERNVGALGPYTTPAAYVVTKPFTSG